MDKQKERCVNCKYWDCEHYKDRVLEVNPLLELDDNKGICHRYPQYEIREKDYWCGEHKPKNERDEQ